MQVSINDSIMTGLQPCPTLIGQLHRRPEETNERRARVFKRDDRNNKNYLRFSRKRVEFPAFLG